MPKIFFARAGSRPVGRCHGCAANTLVPPPAADDVLVSASGHAAYHCDTHTHCNADVRFTCKRVLCILYQPAITAPTELPLTRSLLPE
eukprot:589349-Prymnesium_polylepis.1